MAWERSTGVHIYSRYFSPVSYLRCTAAWHLLPLGALRKRLNELPQDKGKEILCYCKISLWGYESALVLEANGWSNVKVMEGGIVAWPYVREK